MRKKPAKKLARGLFWIWAHAHGDFEVVAGERGTGAFAGTTEKEVDAALDWLKRYVDSAALGRSDAS